MIEFKHVSKKFGATIALDQVSFTLAPNQITAFIGPNGAGKTTSMRIMTQILEPSSGSFFFNEKNVAKDLSAREGLDIRKKFGYLAENNPLYPDMQAGEFLLMTARLRGFPSKKAHTAMARVRNLCNLKNVIQTPISNLSKGYRQRLGVAQALIHDPDILILDEPTSGLDPNQTDDFLNMLSRLSGKTILLSTHILHAIPDFCQNLLFIDEGQLKYQGTPVEFQTRFSPDHTMDQAFRAWTEASS